MAVSNRSDSHVLNVAEATAGPGAIDPDKAALLADRVIALRSEVPSITLDFEGAGPISSGFANMLFLRLADSAPLDTWKTALTFTGLDRRQGEVLTMSLRAARRAVAAEAGAR